MWRHAHGMGGVRVQGDSVGATHILSAERQESFAVDLSADAESVAQQIAIVLEDTSACAKVALRAMNAARLYNSQANAEQLMSLVRQHVPHCNP